MPARHRLRLVLATAALLTAFPAFGAAGFEDPAAATPDATVYSPSFSDVPEGHRFETSIRAVLASGITFGCDAAGTKFCPDEPVTRGQMAAFLTRSLELEVGAEAGDDTDFVDDDDSVFEDDIETLAHAGITRGCNPPTNDRYCPDERVTRGQMAAFLTRALHLETGAEAGDSADFVDDDGSVFENDIERLAHAGITRGCNPPINDRFCPEQPVTRAEMAAFLTRALPLKAPAAIPAGVELQREPSAEGQKGVSLTVCREVESSLVIRSVTADPTNPGLWAPSALAVSTGEPDLATDRWYLPAGTGCDSLEAVWSPRSVDLAAPLETLEVVSHFGPRRHPILGGVRAHNGTDFKARSGDPVFASAPGVVVTAGTRGGYGTMVEVRHVGGLDTRYTHLSSMAVAVGDHVETGEMLGAVGCTGLCTGPHLHFETLEFGTAVNPMFYLAVP